MTLGLRICHTLWPFSILVLTGLVLSVTPADAESADNVTLWESVVPVGVSPPGRFGHDGDMLAEIGEFFMFGGSSTSVFGGSSTSKSSAYNDTWIFNIIESTWQQVFMQPGDQWPLGRTMMTVTRLDSGKIVLYGGLIPDGTILNDLWVFERRSMTWTFVDKPLILNVTSSSGPPARFGHSLVGSTSRESLNGNLILFGGTTMSSIVLGDVWILAPGSNSTDLTWIEVQVAGAGRIALSGHSAVVYQNSMYVFAGHDQAKTLKGSHHHLPHF